VIGQAAKPQALAYRQGMTLMDVLIAVGGVTDFAAGNKANIVRTVDGHQRSMPVRLQDLLRDGDISANVAVLPGDILVIPESWF
jgi:polysaccharide export outer membrane protein